ncbi:MAG TPA: GNAT family N-acetyltransferase [Polyangiales bacterium]|nr:GNAT family N-acetyltransferase [Polyangiales bacterium]
MLQDADLYGRMRAGLVGIIGLFGTASQTSRLVRWPGVTASIVPVTPERSLFNTALFDSQAALDAEYDALERAYAEAGVRAFSVWTDPGDDVQSEYLSARGLKLDGKPLAMGAEIERLALPETRDLAWSHTDSASAVAQLNEAAYRLPGPAWQLAFTQLRDPRTRMYIAMQDGAPAASVLTWDGDFGDCAVCGVATLPQHQRRGLASRLLAVALREARQRGAITTSLQASKQGRAVYARMGYRDLGALSVWEHR